MNELVTLTDAEIEQVSGAGQGYVFCSGSGIDTGIYVGSCPKTLGEVIREAAVSAAAAAAHPK
jgi:hypothetical protein